MCYNNGQLCLQTPTHVAHASRLDQFRCEFVQSTKMLFIGSTHDAMAADIVGLDQLIEEHMTHGDNEYKLFMDAGYPIGKNLTRVNRKLVIFHNS